MAFPSLEKLTAARRLISESDRTRVAGNDAFAKGVYDVAVDSYRCVASRRRRPLSPTCYFDFCACLLVRLFV